MIARSQQRSRIEPSDELLSFDESQQSSRNAAFFAAAFGFLCFMPYPAIGIGNNSALQLGNVATIIALLCATVGIWERVSLAIVFLLLTPQCVSTLKVLLVDGGDASVCFKSTIAWAVASLTLIAVQIHAPRHMLSMLTGIAVAILVHAAIGAYQMYSFQSGVFPLVDLYVNPSFLSVQENAVKLARWEQRPFGLFPEPSAMSSSIGPFVILFAAICFDLVKLRQAPVEWQRYLFATASVAGTGLIIVSRSGHAAPTVAAIALLLVIWLAQARATFKTYAIAGLVFGVAMPIALLFAYNAMSARMSGGTQMGNDSWEERSASLLLGFKAWSERGIATAIFGLGPGLSGEGVKDASGILSVFSVLLSYFYDTGLVGLLAIGLVAQRIVRTWRDARLSPVFAAIAVNWIIGVTLTTSYGQLLPLWIALGLLGSWTEICEVPAARRTTVAPPPRLRRVNCRVRVSPWTLPSHDDETLREPISS
jgi:hypothetical protein